MTADRTRMTISVEDVLDDAGARRIRRLLMRAEPGTAIRLDLSGVLRCDDAALTVLGDAVSRCRRVCVGVSGLSEHQLGVLRSASVAGPQAPPPGAPAEA